MLLQTSEKRPDGLSIYWLADDKTGKRVCGICFENGLLNIANQEIAESLVFALAFAGRELSPFLKQEAAGGNGE